MKITGHGLQQAIREKKALLEVLNTQLTESLRQFNGEEKGDPIAISEEISTIEENLVKLQCAQDIYNEHVTGECLDKQMTLGFAVKFVGGVGRMERFWKNAMVPKRERYAMRNADERSKDVEYAKPRFTTEQALAQHMQNSKKASAIRAFIAKANTTEVDIELLKISPAHLG